MRRVLFALLALLLSVQFSTAQTAPRVLLGERVTSEELAALTRLADDKGVAEVIVGLNVAFAPEGTLDQSEITAQRQQIAAATAALRDLLSADARESIREYQSIPFMAVRVPSEDLDRLAASSHTRSIQRDLENEPASAIPSSTLHAPPMSLTPATPAHGDGQVIAVIDTGILATHAAFTTSGSRIVHQACFSRDGLCSSACTGATNGCETGTHVAGIAAGSAPGFSGVAPGARIMSIRVFGLGDGESTPIALDSDILSGLEEVLEESGEHSIAAVTLGFHDIGRDEYEENCDASRLALKAAIDNLKSVGIATIAASGEQQLIGSTTAPSCISSAVSVGAVSAMNWDRCTFQREIGNGEPTAADRLLCTSNIAPFVSLLAPGAPIRSALPGSNSGYGARGGTAMAAAQVAGAWAVLKQKAPGASVESILGVLKSTGVPIETSEGTIPRIDIPKALSEIDRMKIVYTREGTGTGRVTFTAGAQACDMSCVRVFPRGGEVRLTATASPGSVFAGWSGACDGTSPSCTVAVSNAILVTANFNLLPVFHALTLSKTGNGSITCNGGACEASYRANDRVSLTATPDAGWQFTGWTGACSGTGVCTVTMSQARTVSATFTRLNYALTLGKTGAGNGSFTCNGAACAAAYPSGTSLTLAATPGAGSDFGGWTGCTPVTGKPRECTLTMDQARTVSASFTRLNYALTLAKTGAGNGSFTCNGAACAAAYPSGTSLTLAATPEAGSDFGGWTGCTPVTGKPRECTLTMDQARTVSASFTRLNYALTLAKTGAGNGSFTCNGAACAAAYPSGTSLTLAATPGAGSDFGGWTGCTPVTGKPRECTLTMDQARTVSASFTLLPVFHALTVNTTGSGRVNCNGGACQASYAASTAVTLRATPDSGWRFDGWSGCTASTTTPTECTFTMSQARSVTASFSLLPVSAFTISYTKSGSGAGRVTFASRGRTETCSDNCREDYAEPTRVRLSAAAEPGSVFVGWQGDCRGSKSCTVALRSARSVTAVFERIAEKELAFTKAGTGDGTLTITPRSGTPSSCAENCTRKFALGTTLTLTAVPKAGSVFTGWSGACGGTRTCSLTMDAARSVTANFAKVTLPTITYVKAGSGSGTVSFQHDRRTESCTSTCTKAYSKPSRVRLVATPERGSVFVGWQGDCRGTRSCTLAVTEAKSVTAVFRTVTLASPLP
jgi:hypothetical protein